jgi:hypothetical protein
VEHIMKELVDFASKWTLDLQIQPDVDLQGMSAYRLYSNPKENADNTAADFFYLVPEEERICVCVPSEFTVDALRKTYGVEIDEFVRPGLSDDMRIVCIKKDAYDLNDILCKEFIQHMMGAQAKQSGLQIQAGVSGNAGGCGGM